MECDTVLNIKNKQTPKPVVLAFPLISSFSKRPVGVKVILETSFHSFFVLRNHKLTFYNEFGSSDAFVHLSLCGPPGGTRTASFTVHRI